MDWMAEKLRMGLAMLSQRGTRGLAWIDANHDGIVQSGERGLLSYYGISELNYQLGTYTTTQNGVTQTKQMTSVDLTADTQGTRATIVPEGILLQTSNGPVSLIVSKIEDESTLTTTKDRIPGIEDAELLVSEADRVEAWQGRAANDGEWRVAA